MKKGLLAVFGFFALVLSSDIMASTPVPVYEVKPYEAIELKSPRANVEIRDKATQEKKNEIFSWIYHDGKIEITLLGEAFGKSFDILLNSKKVGEITVPLNKVSLFPETEKAINEMCQGAQQNN